MSWIKNTTGFFFLDQKKHIGHYCISVHILVVFFYMKSKFWEWGTRKKNLTYFWDSFLSELLLVFTILYRKWYFVIYRKCSLDSFTIRRCSPECCFRKTFCPCVLKTKWQFKMLTGQCRQFEQYWNSTALGSVLFSSNRATDTVPLK